MNKKVAITIIITILLAIALTIVLLSSGEDGKGTQSDKIVIVTSIAPLASITMNIVGEVAEVHNLIPPNTSPHTFTLRPSDIEIVSKADVVIVNGLQLEGFLDDLFETAGVDEDKIIIASKDVSTLAAEDGEGVDPHVWLDPARARIMSKTISDELSQMFPEYRKTFFHNQVKFAAAISELDSEIHAAVVEFEDPAFLALHSAYQYFADSYGLYQAGVIEEFPGKAPTPQYLAGLRNIVEEKEVRVVFTEPQLSSQVVEILSQDLNLRVAQLDPIGAELSAAGYEDLIRRNLEVIVSVFAD